MYLTLTQKNQVWKEVALHSPLSAGPSGWREGDTRSTYRYCGTPLLLDCCRLYGCATVPVFVNVYECVDSECAISTTRRLPSTSLWLACLWRVGKEAGATRTDYPVTGSEWTYGPSDSDSGVTLLPGLPCSAGLIAQ